MSVIDNFRFEARSRCGCSNSDYHLYRTNCCCGFCVVDDELSDLYFDPADLRRVSLLRERTDTTPFPCPLCGAAEWDLTEIEELSDVPESWRWACWPR